jgi:hypothetical protein
MLRHLKRRQQELESSNRAGGVACGSPLAGEAHQANGTTTTTTVSNSCGLGMPLSATDNQAVDMKRHHHQQQQQQQRLNQQTEPSAARQQKRVRGRRSSKPAMEKRRRARINECLDILKSYVLNDSTNLNRLGIDLSASENQLDEESIARQILKTSGLINRHRGRKNPNKLEKADILELTVDYVRRLHEQRDELLSTNNQQQPAAFVASRVLANQHQQPSTMNNNNLRELQQQVVPIHLTEPLTLDLSPKTRQNGQINASSTPPLLQAYRPPPNTPLTPPSSASSLQGPGDALEHPYQHNHQNQLTQMQLLSQVLDGRFKLYNDWISLPQMSDQ